MIEEPRKAQTSAVDHGRSVRSEWGRVRGYQPAPGVIPGAIGSLVLGIGFIVLGDTVAEDGRVRFDRWLVTELHSQSSSRLTRLMRLATDLGSAYVTVPLMLAVVGLLFWRQRRHTAAVAAAFWIGAQIIDLITKPLYHRDRPSLFPAFARAGGYSFPSGHTVTAVLTYGLIAAVLARGQHGWRRRMPFAVAAAIVVAVATSRVYLGVHYPSDVLGGMLIGGAWLLFAIVSLGSIDRRQLRRVQTAGGG
jgi:undecaprenyl-diphosphatase